MSPEKLRVGQVAGAVGLAGAVKVIPLTDFSDRFLPGSVLELGGRRLTVAACRPSNGQLVVSFDEVEDRAAAQALAGSYLEISAGEAHALQEGAFYHYQLLGLRARTQSGTDLGQVDDVWANPANDVWVIRGTRGELLVPATRDAVLEVDLAGGQVVIADWLLDVEDTSAQSRTQQEAGSPGGARSRAL